MDQATLNQIANNFTNELIESEKGEKTSLAFIKNTIPSSPIVKDGETFQVMVIGGTNFVNAFITKTNGSIKIEKIENDKLPLLSTKEIFFDFMGKYLDPKTSVLAINLAFPLQPVFDNGKLDGKLAGTSKEHLVEGLINEVIGKTFEEYIFGKRNQKIIVSVANDTICLLASGLTAHSPEGLAAGIVGTGINFALILDKTTLVNLEAGAFAKFPRSEEGAAIDNASLQVGVNIFEKELSGKYLYMHFNMLAKKRGLSKELKSSEELDQLVQEGDALAQEVMRYSAELTATIVTGITNFKQQDMTFVMQGSLFWKAYRYKETVEETVKQLTTYNVNFIDVENSDILGAAKLVA